ncbi:MAG TPA: hypothetical protein VFQ90_04465, partial [Stellaceae bacterium]|nr:hypothetical protein [Stellaceae bacterium]
MSQVSGKPSAGAGPLPRPARPSLPRGHGGGSGCGPARSPETDPTDIHIGDWVDRLLPRWAEPYARLARLDRPIGTWLLL